MMKMNNIAVLLLALTGWWGCRDPDLKELSFFSISLNKITVENVGSLRLEGQVKGLLLQDNVQSCGFVWSFSKDSVLLQPGALRRIPPDQAPVGNDLFSASFSIQVEQTVYFRAVGQLGNRMVYSENIEQAGLGQIVEMDKTAEVLNNNVTVYGRLEGLEALQQSVAAYGHVFSATVDLPTVGAAGCDTTQFLNENKDISFGSQLKDLHFNTTYHVRAYAIDGGQVFYSPQVDTFRVRDGWIRIGDFPSEFNEGMAVANAAGNAFAGSGINNFDGMASDILKDFWRFDPGTETWVNVKDFSNNPSNKVTNASAFAIGDTVYLIFGQHNLPTTLMVRNFWKYAISSNQWFDESFSISIPQSIFSGRSGAAGFVLGSKIYVGTGEIIINGSRKYFNDFWEYTPNTGNWRRVKSLPMNTTQGVQMLGRYEAVGFASNTYGYVGGGEVYGLTVNDFWRFTPPLTQNPQDSGAWTLLPNDFPGLGRAGAISFTIGGKKAYYGCGYNLVEYGLSDFYEFDLMTEKWAKKTPFQGGRRYDMIAFGVNQFGYCGTGVEKRAINSGQSTEQVIHKDFWRYIPESP